MSSHSNVTKPNPEKEKTQEINFHSITYLFVYATVSFKEKSKLGWKNLK